MRLRALTVLLLAAALVWAAPLLGLALSGHAVARYLEFPVRTRFVPHAPFDWWVFAVLCLPVAATAVLYGLAIARGRPATRAQSRERFPAWGWLGLGLMAAAWYAAWSGAMLAPEWRRYAFTPLWIGYILAMNGLAYRQSGRSPLTHRTRGFLALFPASMVFWWLFEYLNQFSGNWYYTGIEARGGWDYFFQATLPFSTVLPAVASTWAWLGQLPRVQALQLPALRGCDACAWPMLAAGVAALLGIGVAPEALYPALWVAPLLVLWGLQQLVLGETAFAPLRRGDWAPFLQPPLAALACGLLWELWNSGSAAQWHYSVPYVQRFHVFEMPLLGYAGYLPFGLECALVIDLVARCVRQGED